MTELFWLSNAQLAVIEPLLPHLGGKPRVDDQGTRVPESLIGLREGAWQKIAAHVPPDITMER